jgi:hypothetical protein
MFVQYIPLLLSIMRKRPIEGDLTLSKNGVRKCVMRYVNGVSDFKINFNINFQIQSFTPDNTKITFEYNLL